MTPEEARELTREQLLSELERLDSVIWKAYWLAGDITYELDQPSVELAGKLQKLLDLLSHQEP